MSFMLKRPLDVPIREEDGVPRVGATRVTLHSVIRAFQEGAHAEEIVSFFPSLDLKDVYAVLAFYLANRPIVDPVLAEYEAKCADEHQAAGGEAGSAAYLETLSERIRSREAKRVPLAG